MQYDVTALGELLIDFTPGGKSENGMQLFEQNPGGAPANVLYALSNFGKKTAFIGKVGEDMHGQLLHETLNSRNVDTTGLVSDPNVFTTLAFVQLSDTGERNFSFARKPGADCCLRPEEVNADLLHSCRVFHFGSLSMTDEPARSATIHALEIAKKAGVLISYDPNYREALWPDRDVAVTQMRSVLPYVEIMKLSDNETELLTGEESIEAAASKLLSQGIRCVVVTLGKKGAFVATAGKTSCVPTFSAPVVDTTGAGDAFWGGFLYKLLEQQIPMDNHEKLRECARFGNAVATLCVGKRGAIPALPKLEDAIQLYESGKRSDI